jgi:hypothetical protein
MGPGGDEATLVKRRSSMYDKPPPNIPHGKRTPDYHQIDQAQDTLPIRERQIKAKKQIERDTDPGAE